MKTYIAACLVLACVSQAHANLPSGTMPLPPYEVVMAPPAPPPAVDAEPDRLSPGCAGVKQAETIFRQSLLQNIRNPEVLSAPLDQLTSITIEAKRVDLVPQVEARINLIYVRAIRDCPSLFR